MDKIFPRFQMELYVVADNSKKYVLNEDEFLKEFERQTKDLLLNAFQTICRAGNELTEQQRYEKGKV